MNATQNFEMQNFAHPNNGKLRHIDLVMFYNLNKENRERQANVGIIKKSAVKTNLPRRILVDGLIGTRQKGMVKRRNVNVTLATQVIELPLCQTRLNFRNFNHCHTRSFKDKVRGKMRKGN